MITLLFSGDYHIYGCFDKIIRANPTHKVFSKSLNNLVQESDLAVFNLEDPITSNRTGILKHGPHGVGSIESLLPIKEAGFLLATFATNHTYDMGDQGIIDTLDACKKYNIEVVGAGLTKENARKSYYKNLGEQYVAILNFSRVEYNAVSNTHGGANPLNIIDNTRDIIEAKKIADLVFVVVHEGADVFHLPYPELVKQMRFYAAMGADAIILHHSRIFSGYEIYKNTPIFYGLGNLLHLTKNKDEHTGLMVRFAVNSNKQLDFEILPVELDADKIHVSLCMGTKKQQTLNKVEQLSAIIKDEQKLRREWDNHVNQNKAIYLSILAGHPRLFYRIAKKAGFIGLYKKLLLLNKKKYLSVWNILKCQAHREAASKVFEDIFER
jgi:poly-gamma-glutamate capsule biosynthesis protein CapA/YwtB (metallophosphatase superfamily)